MKTAEHETEKQIASAAEQECKGAAKGPSSPAAFAEWWAEYRNKLTKPESADRADFRWESLQ
jgi:hypothetical protein